MLLFPRNSLPLRGRSLPPSQTSILCSVSYFLIISWKCDPCYHDFPCPGDSWKSHLPHSFLADRPLLSPPQVGDCKGLHTGMKTESLSSFYTRSVFVLLLYLSFINTHICMHTKIWADPFIWRLWKYFLILWNYPFHWVIFKQQLGLGRHRCLSITRLPTIISLRLLAVSWALLSVLFLVCLFWNLRALMVNLWPGFLSFRMLLCQLEELSTNSGFDLGYTCDLRPGHIVSVLCLPPRASWAPVDWRILLGHVHHSLI